METDGTVTQETISDHKNKVRGKVYLPLVFVFIQPRSRDNNIMPAFKKRPVLNRYGINSSLIFEYVILASLTKSVK